MSITIKTSVIKKVHLKTTPWVGREDKLYFHAVELENGDSGEMGGCKEANPSWLMEGKSLTYRIEPGKFNKRIIWREDGSANVSIRPAGSASVFRGESHTQWLTSKKSVIMDSCLNRAKDLVAAKAISFKQYRKHAMDEYNFILKELSLISEVPEEVAKLIDECETLNDLSSVQESLTKEQQENPAIIKIIKEKSSKLSE